VHMLLDRGADGMIFISCEMTNMSGEHDHYGRLVEEGARLVFVNGALNTLNVPSVGVDERTAGELATQHLIDLGHERIGYVAGPDHYLPTRQKAAGRRSALRAASLDPDGLVAYGDDFTVEGGRAAVRELLAAKNRPTGVICSSDLMAIGAVQEATEQGLRVPEDLSIVGFDGIEATAWTNPALTTVEQPIEEIAETAVNALRTMMDAPRKPLPDSFFRPRLRERASTGPPA
jgi:DNA-binding LacI/PurR family transcriptional regulator